MSPLPLDLVEVAALEYAARIFFPRGFRLETATETLAWVRPDTRFAREAA